jgi:DNA ligase-associated metallophosphoesterase
MNAHTFTLAGAALTALPSGALWWPDQGLLAVSDLHLGRSGRIARLGGTLLPPYEADETLSRLDADIDRTSARTVLCLGDSFDDMEAAGNAGGAEGWLLRMMAGRRWIWVAGNHDPAPLALPGDHLAELRLGPLTFRHAALATALPPAEAEVSGHYHPKARIAGQSRRCFLYDRRRLILPAYGAYTGGLSSSDTALSSLFGAGAIAVLTGAVARPLPMPR